MHNENTKRQRKKRTEEIFEAIMTKKFAKFVIDPGTRTPRRINAPPPDLTKAYHIHTAEN